MSTLHRWRAGAAAFAASGLLLACGGGSDGTSLNPSPPATPVSPLPQEPGAPALVNNVATDGYNWINYRRMQAGMPGVARNAQLDQAAQGHSDYQKANGAVGHDQQAGKPGFTGARLIDRLAAAGYTFPNANYAYGEVISAASSNTGFYMAEELITAVYHRFVIFEPKFKELGTGAATSASGYIYFTSDFAARGGYGPGIGGAKLATWPFDGQGGVAVNFFSDYETPDPVASANEVGYPVSVHADIDVALGVTSFTLRPRGGAELAVQLLKGGPGSATPPPSAAAIVPLAVLKARTVYEVNFSGTANGTAFTRNWSFTTR